ncbi:MAG: M6 family metalloprotease domain-containing protein, partial [Burkholderiales bacterium]
MAHEPSHDAAYLDDSYVAGNRSLRAYYREISFGALTVQATIVPTWWRSVRTLGYYGDDRATVDDANGSIYQLVSEAVALADPTVDFSAFDADGNDIVDHLIVVHAGGAQEEEPEDVTRIWSHQWSVPSLFADGERISGYVMVGEGSPVGVLAHEFAHDLAGLPDLYDLDESSEGGVGRWDLMAQGAWNGFPYGTSPAHLSAWSRIRLGWT